MSEIFPEHNPNDLEVFAGWGNHIFTEDQAFAETVINGVIGEAFPEASTLDKTE